MKENFLIRKVPVARGYLAAPRDGKKPTSLKHRGRAKVVLAR